MDLTEGQFLALETLCDAADDLAKAMRNFASTFTVHSELKPTAVEGAAMPTYEWTPELIDHWRGREASPEDWAALPEQLKTSPTGFTWTGYIQSIPGGTELYHMLLKGVA